MSINEPSSECLYPRTSKKYVLRSFEDIAQQNHTTWQTIFHLCIPKKELAKLHFYGNINKIFPKKSYNVLSGVIYSVDKYSTLQRYNTENWKQIFPEKELRSLSPNFHIHVSVNDLHIPMLGLPILLQEDMWTDPGNI